MRYLPAIIAACAAMQLHAFTAPPCTVLHSPDSADTYADNTMLWHQLRWKPKSQELVATITFSNFHRLSDIEPRHDETFEFRIPGVKFSPAAGTFSVRTRNGGAIPIAALRNRLFVKSIVLSPNAQVQVIRRSGHIAVDLVVKNGWQVDERWAEMPYSLPRSPSHVHGDPLTSS